MTTKVLHRIIGTMVIGFGILLLSSAFFYLSLRTALHTNQDASATLVKSLDDSRIAAATSDKLQNDQNITRILSLLDRQLDSIKDLTKQNQDLGEQNKKLQETAVALAQQVKSLQEGENQILAQHTNALQEQKVRTKKAQDAAETAAVDTRRALRAIVKPTPKPWHWGPFGAQPTPAPRPRRRQ
jgi:hypothetical protein